MSDFPPPDLSNATSDLYRAILLRDPDAAGMAYFTARLREHGLRRVLEEFLASDEYRALSRTGPNPDSSRVANADIAPPNPDRIPYPG